MAQLDPVTGDPWDLIRLLTAWDAEADPAPLIVETSGSTGSPKRVRLSRDALRSSVEATHGYVGGAGQWLLALPGHHVAGLQVLYRNVRAEQQPVVVAGSGPVDWERAVSQMEARRRYAAVVPTQLVRLLDADDEAGIIALSRLDAVLVGGGPLSAHHRERAETAGVRVVMTYGMSETCGGCVYDGYPLDGVALKLTQEGEILLRGPSLFEGYARADGELDREATRSALREGWFRTADLGTIDADGRVRVLGRRDQVILSGGLNVPGGAVERQLLAHPQVKDVAVVGVPHAEWGEQVTAVVVAAGEPPDLAGLRALIDPRAWAPHALVVVAQLPRTDTGKVDRVAARTLAHRAALTRQPT